MTKAETEKLQNIFDELLGKWQKSESNNNDEYHHGKSEAFSQSVIALKDSFPFLTK